MNEPDFLASQFEQNRSHLRAVAYRMLGSLSEADDAVQEAWLKLSRSDAGGIDNLGGWLTTVVARVCLDMLRSRNARREDSLEEHVDAPRPPPPPSLAPTLRGEPRHRRPLSRRGTSACQPGTPARAGCGHRCCRQP